MNVGTRSMVKVVASMDGPRPGGRIVRPGGPERCSFPSGAVPISFDRLPSPPCGCSSIRVLIAVLHRPRAPSLKVARETHRRSFVSRVVCLLCHNR